MACPVVMGVLNVTPDSFSDAGHTDRITETAAKHRLCIGERGSFTRERR